MLGFKLARQCKRGLILLQLLGESLIDGSYTRWGLVAVLPFLGLFALFFVM
jgi:hypothetical protein